MEYCKKCLYPSTKPDLWFRDGVCGACHTYEEIRSNGTYGHLSELKQYILSRKVNKNYDCIVPVSGGKDSTYQVVKILKMGLNPLCVTAPTDFMPKLGQENLENLKRLGVDHIQISVNNNIRKKINKYAFLSLGDIQWPEHVLIFTAPVIIAAQLEIPTLIWGECQMREYGAGPEATKNQLEFTRSVMEEFGGFNGMRVTDLTEFVDEVTEKDLYFYTYPEEKKLSDLKISGVYLDYFLPWSGIGNSIIAQAHGFKTHQSFLPGSIADYENLDNYVHGIHDYFKYLKFGFGRATDVACNYIRRGILSRDEASDLVRIHDGRFPADYLDKSLPEILSYYDISMDEFSDTCDAFTNYDLFKTDSNGNLIKREDGSPVLIDNIR